MHNGTVNETEDGVKSMARENIEGSVPKSLRTGKKDETEKMNELWKLFEKQMVRIVKEAVLEEREICAGIALWRQNIYTDMSQKNVCKEIYSSIRGRLDNE